MNDYDTMEEMKKETIIGIVLPVKKKDSKLSTFLESFSKSILKTRTTNLTTPESDAENEQNNYKFFFFVGVSPSDDVCMLNDKEKVEKLFQTHFQNNSEISYRAEVILIQNEEESIYSSWRYLSLIANECSFDYLLFLSDSVEIQGEYWVKSIENDFESISKEMNVPFGFGCVIALTADGTFPILHKSHFKRLNHEIFSNELINQNADQYVYEMYARFGCAKVSSKLILKTCIGNQQQQNHKDPSMKVEWSKTHLPKTLSILSNQELMNDKKEKISHFLALDVVVPTFRSDVKVLKSILNLRIPEKTLVRFTIVFDNPDSELARNVFSQLREEYQMNPNVRFRMNSINVGAIKSRNVGLSESIGDYVLFLDDDVSPVENLIEEYCKVIVQHPNASGFIGRTILPECSTPKQYGIKLAGCTYFWDIAKDAKNTMLPWGITANLIVKREPTVMFRDIFPRTGGGEDCDLCIRINEKNNGNGFVPVPNAIVYHDWWNNGSPKLAHFYGWAIGDSALVDLHPTWTFYSYPNFMEMYLLILIFSLSLLIYSSIQMNLELCMKILQFNLYFFIAEWMVEIFDQKKLLKQHGFQYLAQICFHTLAVRFSYEYGRIHGHLSRGNIQNFLVRFQWFGDYWKEWSEIEKLETYERTKLRLLGGALIIFMLF